MGAEQEPRGLFIAAAISIFEILVDHAQKNRMYKRDQCLVRLPLETDSRVSVWQSDTRLRPGISTPGNERQENEERVLERN